MKTTLLAAILLVLLTTCAKQKDSPPLFLLPFTMEEEQPRSQTDTIGPEGGQMTLPDGATLTIPRGALEAEIQFNLTRNPTPDNIADSYTINPALTFHHEVLLSVPLRNLRPAQKIHATLQQEPSTRTRRVRTIFTGSESIPVAVERERDRAQIRLTQTGSVTVEVGIQNIAFFELTDLTPGLVPQNVRVCAEASAQITIHYHRRGGGLPRGQANLLFNCPRRFAIRGYARKTPSTLNVVSTEFVLTK